MSSIRERTRENERVREREREREASYLAYWSRTSKQNIILLLALLPDLLSLSLPFCFASLTFGFIRGYTGSKQIMIADMEKSANF
jgi:hypothetical protein